MADARAKVEPHVEHRSWSPPVFPSQGDGAREAATYASLNERDIRRETVREAISLEGSPWAQPAGVVARPAAPATDALGEADVLAFVMLLLDPIAQGTAPDHVGAIQARGISLDEIYLGLFQPAARHIGDLWADDRCSFVDVTLAVSTMQTLLRVLEPVFHRASRAPDERRQALLLPLPGDQHTFGLSMVSQFFRRAGWSVWSTPLPSLDDLRQIVSTSPFALVGFSASDANKRDQLAAAIRIVRQHACVGRVTVMVGGPLFVENPDYAAQVGADALGLNATDALTRAESFIASATGP